MVEYLRRVGEEPPADIKRFLDLGSTVAVSPQKYEEFGGELRQLLYDNVYFIGLTGNVKKPVLASRNLEKRRVQGLRGRGRCCRRAALFQRVGADELELSCLRATRFRQHSTSHGGRRRSTGRERLWRRSSRRWPVARFPNECDLILPI